MEKAPLYDELADGPETGSAYWLKTQDGVRIRAAFWPSPAHLNKGTILLFNGRTEYVEKYAHNALRLTESGFNVLTLDWRGQGLSDRLLNERLRGHVEDFSHYQLDVQAVLDLGRQLVDMDHLYLLAHSMGGAIGLRALHEGLPVRAAAFTGPMWGLHLSTQEKLFAWFVRNIGRHFGMKQMLTPTTTHEPYVHVTSFEENTLTTHRGMWDMVTRQLEAQPDLSLGGPSVHWTVGAFGEFDRFAELDPPDVPTITFLGTDEIVTSPDVIKEMMKRWEGGKLVVLEGCRHEIMAESDDHLQTFYKELEEWFHRH